MNTTHFDKNGKPVNIGDWVWFNDPNIGNPYIHKRGVIVKFNDDDSVKLVNSDGYFNKDHKIVTEFNEYLTAIEK